MFVCVCLFVCVCVCVCVSVLVFVFYACLFWVLCSCSLFFLFQPPLTSDSPLSPHLPMHLPRPPLLLPHFPLFSERELPSTTSSDSSCPRQRRPGITRSTKPTVPSKRPLKHKLKLDVFAFFSQSSLKCELLKMPSSSSFVENSASVF